VLTRPNLAVAVFPLLFLLRDRRSWLQFGLAAIPGLIALAWLNEVRYGSPLVSGYGGTGGLFSAAHIVPNLRRYPRWLLDTETPLILLAVMMPWVAWQRRWNVRLTVVTSVSAVLIVATYLAYTVFDDWWYIRFLLPVLPIVIVFSVAAVIAAGSWLMPGGHTRGGVIVAVVLCAVLGTWYVHVARARQVRDLQALESRFVQTGEYAAHNVPAAAVFLAGQQSGAVRYHGGRATLSWDAIPPDALDRIVRELAAAGHPVFLALEEVEEPAFRRRFAGQQIGALDWPPRAQVGVSVHVRIYDPNQRAGPQPEPARSGRLP